MSRFRPNPADFLTTLKIVFLKLHEGDGIKHSNIANLKERTRKPRQSRVLKQFSDVLINFWDFENPVLFHNVKMSIFNQKRSKGGNIAKFL